MALQFVLGQNLLGPKGSDGNTIIGVRGPPDGAVGKLGDYAYDVTNVVFYGPKTSNTAWPAGIPLKGPKGDSTPQTLPQDFVANSFIAAPQSGDTAPVQYALKNSAGTQVFTVDAQGNISTTGTLSVSGAANTGALTAASAAITGNETVGGNLTVTGTSTLGTLQATNLNLSGSETIAGDLTVQGKTTLGVTSTGALTATSLTSTGTTQSTGHIVTSNGTAAAPAFSFLSQQDTGLYLVTASGTAAILGLSVNGILALSLQKGGISVPGTLSVSGNITGAQALTLTGNATVQSLSVTQSTSQNGSGQTLSAVTFPGQFGNGSYPPSGISSDSFGNLIFSYQGRSVIAMANPGYNSQVGTTPSTAFGINFTAGAYTFGAGGATALLIGANGSTTIGGGLSGNSFPCIITQQAGTVLSLRQGTNVVGTFDTGGNGTLAGALTAAALTLSGSGAKLTFGDGSVQTTAYTSTTATNQPKWIATTQGTAAAPAHTFSANLDSGLYLSATGTTGAQLALSVNATNALLLNAGGISVPGTLGVTGNSTLTGTLKTGSITLATNGTLTFADGTTQSTAAGAAAAAGSAATFTATSNGSAAAPAFTFSNSTNTGFWLVTSGPQLIATVGGTNTVAINKGSVSVTGPLSTSGTLNVTGLATLSGGVSAQGSVVTNTVVQGGNGSVGAPTFASASNTNTGIYFDSATGAQSRMYIGLNGTLAASFLPGGQLTMVGPVSAAQFTGQTYAATNTNGSAGSVQFGIANTTGLYVNTATSGNPVVGLSQGSTTVLSANNNGLTVPVSSNFTAPATHTATVTSTTPAGTPSFVSSQGFVTSAYGGGYACSATAAPTTPQGLYTTISFPDGSTPQVVGRSYINERGAGSVVGFHFYLQNSLTTTCQVRMNVNGTNTPYVTIAAGSTTASVSYAKGAYPIPNNGYCYMMVMFGSASTGSIPQLQGGFTLELPA